MDESYTSSPPPPFRIGRTKVLPLVLGQDASNLSSAGDLKSEAYFIGEVILVLRSNGGWTVGQIKDKSDQLFVIACEQKLIKNVPLTSAHSMLKKVIGSFYVFEGCIPAVQQRSAVRGTPPEVTIGESVFQPLVIGQECRQNLIAADWDKFYEGEVVAVLKDKRWTIGEIQSTTASTVMIFIDERHQLQVRADVLRSYVCKLIGSFYLAPFACPVPSSLGPGSPHDSPSPCRSSWDARSENAQPATHFDNVERGSCQSAEPICVQQRRDKKFGAAPPRVDEADQADKGPDDKKALKDLKECCDQQLEREIKEAFEAHKHIEHGVEHIPKDSLREALSTLNIYVSDCELAEFLLQNDANGDGVIDFEEFRAAVLMPSPVEDWAASLNLPRLLAHFLPRQVHSGQTLEPIRAVAELKEKEQAVIAEKFCDELKAALKVHVARLQTALSSLDQARDTQDVKKFDVVKMDNCGTIKDFFGGLQSRIGSSHENFFTGMRLEHCEKQTCNFEFKTPNFHIVTTSEKEWGIVMEKKSCPDEHQKEGRSIPDIDKLFESETAKKSNLTREEVIGLVLYTGPMFHVYNTILRQIPGDLYNGYKAAKNFFPTTIHVIVSAVLNISRTVKLPDGLRLYRGLGGTTALPDSFFKSDENGCKGFVEWGFMSTTSEKEVAIKYSGVKDKKPLPLLLSVRVSAVDRGACIREFSQYKKEVEYLYVPCSFLQQDGPPLTEVGKEGIIKIYPVLVNTNLKSLTVQETLEQKKNMHIEAFQCLIEDVKSALDQMALKRNADQRLLEDSSHDQNYTVEGFCARIIEQCREKLAEHMAKSRQDYANPNVFQGLVLDMMDVKGMAMEKLEEWLVNKTGSYIRFRWNAKLRTVHRRWIAYLESEYETCQPDKKREAAIRLCKVEKLIIESVDEKNELGETPIMVAAAGGYPPRHLKLLVDAGADVKQARPEDGVVAMWLAAQFGHCLSIQTLHDLNASVDQAANDGATPVYIAAQNGKYDCIELLIKLNANANSADNKVGLTPVHQAAMNGQDRCIKLLCDNKANVCAMDKNGLTALHYAAMNGHANCIQALQKAGAPMDSASKDGSTPLHVAARNGKDKCIQLLCDLDGNLDLTQKDGNGNTPAGLAGRGNEACVKTMKEIIRRKGIQEPSFKAPVQPAVIAKKKTLVISTGDISDIDGFFALARYAKTGADVLFIMNYPAYVGVSLAELEEIEEKYADKNPNATVNPPEIIEADNNSKVRASPAQISEMYAENNPGLGYKYSATEVFANSKTQRSHQYNKLMETYQKLSDNDRMKTAMTDLAFSMANSVWKEASSGGKLMFCIGGINAINPFSADAIKNEISIYAAFVENKPKTPQSTNEGSIYDDNAEPCTVDWSAYSHIYIDFNGSMAFWNESWQNTLSSADVVNNIQGAFIMGGVYTDKEPTTMPSIPSVLNRFSCATMNQLYHPQKAGEFFAFLKQNDIEAYTITNNEIGDLGTFSVEEFMRQNGIGGDYLRRLAVAYYESQYKPPRKPFDLYTAIVLTEKMNITGIVPSTERRLHFSSVYGATFVSEHVTWGPTISEYTKKIDTKPAEQDNKFQRMRKENFNKELALMKTMTTMNSLDVHNVRFQRDESWKLSIMNAEAV